MSDQDKDDEQSKPKIVFAEGCFDNFEGTQEELDEMIAAIHEIFGGKTREEIGAMSIPLDDLGDLEDIEDEVMELLPLLNQGNVRH